MNRIEAEQWLRSHPTGEIRNSSTGFVYSYSSFWETFHKHLETRNIRETIQSLPEGAYDTFRTLPSLPELAVWRTKGHSITIEDSLKETRYGLITDANERKCIVHTMHILQALLDEYDGRL